MSGLHDSWTCPHASLHAAAQPDCEPERTELRAGMKRRRAALSTEARARESADIVRHLLDSPEWQNADCIFTYISVGDEVDTYPILHAALAQHKRLCVPKCIGRAHMLAVEIGSLARLSPGRYGIPEPDSSAECAITPDIVITPGLAFDAQGGRIGYGGGFYDAYLARTHAPAIALAYACQLLECVPMSTHDAHMHAICTGGAIIYVRQ